MTSPPKRLASIIEVVAVLAIGFGPAIVQTVRIAYREWALNEAAPRAWLTDTALLRLAGVELVALILISLIGLKRGWSIKSFGWRMTWPLTGLGLAFFSWAFLAYRFLPLGIHFEGHVTLPVLLATMIVNALYEESLEVGYVFRAAGNCSTWQAILASALLRAFIHFYAGWTAMLAVFIGGVLAALIYARWRSLWPLFLVHFLDDILVLFPLL